MKAREHLATNSILLILLIIAIILIGKWNIINLLFNGQIFLIFTFGVGFYFLGTILPDADSNNRGSYIYHKKWLFILAHLVSWLEYPIARFITKRSIGHRQSLHTIIGITITSLFVIILMTLIYWYIYKDISLIYIFYWYFSLFIGQFLHLGFDGKGFYKQHI